MRSRLFVLLLAGTVLVWSAAAAWINISTRNDVQRVLDNRLIEAAGMVASLARNSASNLQAVPGGGNDPAPVHVSRQLSCQIWTLDGRLVGRSGSAPKVPLSRINDGFSEKVINGEQWRVYSLVEPQAGLRILVGDNLKVRRNLIADVLKGLLVPAVVGIVALAVLLWSAIGQGLSPMRRVTDELSMRAPDEIRPLEVEEPVRELAPLVGAINGLFERLDELRASERHFIASAAHELQTPLAGLKAHAQIALATDDPTLRERSLRSIEASVDRTSRLVEQLLDLAREEARTSETAPGWTSLASVFQSIAEEAQIFLERRQVQLRLDAGAANADIRADEAALTLALRNLIRNAVEHSPQGSDVRVSVARNEGMFAIQVFDEGAGIPPAELSRIRERFVRGSGAKGSGSGLGLSIVELVAAGFGATLTLANRTIGGWKPPCSSNPTRSASGPKVALRHALHLAPQLRSLA
ncbi:ATP-binding protein [Sphingomonas ginsengisoli (ex An et al. 2013)]|uniref:ATP-binding protein n=1 Tax=Sphingomonas ginsengisoli (ex An et al. 2013) TaxID=363835 RepID=UPI001447D182|nr:ATP-binding protein [Sphingomonas ginsengisoli An et al. 2013]